MMNDEENLFNVELTFNAGNLCLQHFKKVQELK